MATTRHAVRARARTISVTVIDVTIVSHRRLQRRPLSAVNPHNPRVVRLRSDAIAPPIPGSHRDVHHDHLQVPVALRSPLRVDGWTIGGQTPSFGSSELSRPATDSLGRQNRHSQVCSDPDSQTETAAGPEPVGTPGGSTAESSVVKSDTCVVVTGRTPNVSPCSCSIF